ncbi:MAG: Ohr family peroxiredoxin [Hyphomicrobiales bacterium]|nr:Ohr family peroxiredoxin [Hyphomicrobiales bacterium]MDE2017558.1 Ohr family peroxiredoxin [Hyphomicrobiales bacterium]
MISPIKTIYTAHATAQGGRNGHSKTSDGTVAVELATPKADGSSGRPGATTPEHLFAVGYAACFAGALDFVGKQHKVDASKASVTCHVQFGLREAGGAGIAVDMDVVDKSLPTAELRKLVDEAHEKICPYSHATRDNVAIHFKVEGA